MQSLPGKIRHYPAAVALIWAASGILLCYLYDSVRFALDDLESIPSFFFYPTVPFIIVAAFELVLVAVSGAIASLIVLAALHYLLRPTRLRGFVVCSIVFFAWEQLQLLYYWPLYDIKNRLLFLVSSILAGGVFLAGAFRLTSSNPSNRPMQPAAKTGR